MNPRGNDRLRQLLAAEYALGTLRGGARRRFERWSRDDAGLRGLAYEWSDYLATLTDRLVPTTPPQRVWEAIEARLSTGERPRASAAVTAAPWWERVGFWRGLSVAFAAVATLAIGLAMRPPAVIAPQIIEAVPQSIATIADPKSGQVVAVVMASSAGDTLLVKVADTVEVPAGKDLQLWVAPKDEKVLLSMGVIPASAKTTAFKVGPDQAAVFRRAAAFGLSLEPAGGSPQPTQVLGLGNVVRVGS